MKTSPLLLLCLGAALLTPAHADLDIGISAEIRLGRALPPPPPEVIVVEESGPPGPPPWAPAHGRGRAYYYYPGDNVYYRPADRVWFYLDGGSWRFGSSLPPGVRVDFHRSVALELEGDQPFHFHDRVRSHYPSDYFVTKVRVKEKGGNSGKAAASDRGHDDNRGQNKGKGKGKNK